MKRFALCLALCAVSVVSLVAGTASLPSGKIVLLAAGAPTEGTNEIQTITFGSGQVSGTFFLRFNNRTTPAITWSATNATLVANIDAALETLGNIGIGGVTTAAGSLTAGVGTVTVTFIGNNAKSDVALMTVPSKTTSGTITVLTTTPGVIADGRNSPQGTMLIAPQDGDGKIYVNLGSPPQPIWTLAVDIAP